MRTNNNRTVIDTEYYCDLCNKQIEGYSSRGSPTYASELIGVCAFCGKDTCPSCRSEVCGWHMCLECQEHNKDILNEITSIEADYRARRECYFQKIRELLKVTGLKP